MKLLKLFKKKYPGCILIFRMGENYETFYKDAEVCSKILGVSLTIRNKQNRFIPFVNILSCAIESCIRRLVAANCKIVVFEQMETRNSMMDITRRDVVRVVVPNLI
jgi:DNA mismatch repair protein MutS